MANPFFIEPANPLQALMSGQQGYDRAQKQGKEDEMMAARQRAAEMAKSGGDMKGPLFELLTGGDIPAAKAVAEFAHHQATQQHQAGTLAESQRQHDIEQTNKNRDFGLRESEIGRTQGNTNREYDFKVKQAEEAAKGFDLREVDDNDGGKVLIRTNKATGKSERVEIGGNQPEPRSPYAPTTKLTEGESKDRQFVDRMVGAHNIINDLEKINQGAGGFVGGVLASKPMIRDNAVFNKMASEDRQKSIQAQRNFVNAILRKESGAAISQPEFENAQKQYFPQPGDGPQVIEQKRNNRMQAIESMMQGTGRGYKPPASYTGTKGPAYPSGTPTGQETPAGQSALPGDKGYKVLKVRPRGGGTDADL